MRKLCLGLAIALFAAGAALPQTISLISPNGGEDWVLGSVHPITWTPSVEGNLRILLFKGTQNIGIIKDSVPVAQGSFTWTVGSYQGGTAVPGSDYKVRIRVIQTELWDASDRAFSLSPAGVVPGAGAITVNEPNGGETLWTGTAYWVRWTAANIQGSLTIRLKKGGVALQTWSAANTGSALWMCQGVPDGTDYRVRVESGDGTIADESDRNFEIKTKTVSAPPDQPPSIPPAISVPAERKVPGFRVRKTPPEILELKLNGGAERTDNATVTMDHTVRNTPTHYRWKNEKMADWSPWTSYSGPAPRAEIARDCGGRTVRLQLKNADGESNIAEDAITYFFYRDVTVNAGEAKTYCGSDWVFRITKRGCIDVYEPMCAQLQFWTDHISCDLNKIQLAEVPLGYDAEFQIFAGRFLKAGWTFVSSEWDYWYSDMVIMENSTAASSPEKGFSLDMAPSAGQQGIAYYIKLWVNIGQRGSGTFNLRSLTLRGPCDQPVSEAFR
jgi:hypothetical protein